MRHVFRALIYLVVAAAIGLVGFAIFSDLPAPRAEISLPVDAM